MSVDCGRELRDSLIDKDVAKALNVAAAAWASSKKSALIQSVCVFGVLVFVVFIAFGANQDQGLHWATKEATLR